MEPPPLPATLSVPPPNLPRGSEPHGSAPRAHAFSPPLRTPYPSSPGPGPTPQSPPARLPASSGTALPAQLRRDTPLPIPLPGTGACSGSSPRRCTPDAPPMEPDSPRTAGSEQIEHRPFESFGRRAAGKRPEIHPPPESRRHHHPRKRMIDRQFHKHRRTNPRDSRPIFRKIPLREFQMNQRRFKLRRRPPVFDPLHHSAQIQHPRDSIPLRYQPLQPPPEQRSASQIGSALPRPQKKNGRSVGNRFEL